MMRAAESTSCTLKVLSSEELACRAQAGSLPSFTELVHRYQGRLYNFLLRRIGDEVETEDLTQETFLRAWQRIDQYKPKWRFSTWLYTIGSRLAINQYRAASRRRQVELTAPLLEKLAAGTDASPVSDRKEAALDNVWDVALRLLTPDQHAMVWLRYAEDLNSGEIARVMGKTQISVRVSLHRARERIAEAMRVDDSKIGPARVDHDDVPLVPQQMTGELS